MATLKLSYPQDAETLYKFLSDPETARRRSVAFGERDVVITTNGSAVTNTRKVEAEVPGFAKKLFNPVNTVVEVKAWNPTTKSAQLSVETQGTPVKLSGTIRITPSGSGSEYAIDFTVTCKVPLIGGQLEKYVTGVTEEGMRREYDWNKSELAKL